MMMMVQDKDNDSESAYIIRPNRLMNAHHCETLRELDLSNCELMSLPSDLSHCIHLERLILA